MKSARNDESSGNAVGGNSEPGTRWIYAFLLFQVYTVHAALQLVIFVLACILRFISQVRSIQGRMVGMMMQAESPSQVRAGFTVPFFDTLAPLLYSY